MAPGPDPQFLALKPDAYKPYFDGQSILYAGLSFLTNGTATDEGSFILLYRRLNAFTWVGGCVLLFFSAQLLCASALTAAALTLIYAMTWTLVGVSLLRIDHLIMCLLMAVILLSLVIARRQTSPALAALLGALLALTAMTKISSILLCAVPLPAIIVALRRGWWTCRHLVALVLVGVTLTAFLAVRYLSHAGDLFEILAGKYRRTTGAWETLVGMTPLSYYSWEFPILQYGAAFTVVTLAASLMTLVEARRSAAMATIALPLAGLTLFGMTQLKYHHFGLSFVPFYILAVAAAAGWIEERWPRWTYAVLVLPALALPVCVPNFVEAARAAVQRNASIEITRIRPRQWVIDHVRSGSRVGYYLASQVTLPQVWDLPFRFGTELFEFPYQDGDRMRTFAAPGFGDVEARYDVILLNDSHIAIYEGVFRAYGAPDRQAEWNEFAEELGRRYPTVRFRAETKNYGVQEAVVHVINPAALITPIDRGENLLLPAPGKRSELHR